MVPPAPTPITAAPVAASANAALAGETISVPERLIVAPSVGIFRSVVTGEGVSVEPGAVVGFVDGPGASAPVTSAFRGTLVGMLAYEGERLRAGQPVAWLRVA